ncbi:polysaccharide export protein EpsE [Nitrogeniibacter mangrovi]|uniref:Polysaccharide export protein EpsE n=1 Tax=Nitrogeniibacter mangrovi TaxID=2016596 RepID=A0A6C1AZG6_9RHOO|nr:polysaccharide export protein EpsE [Nitrogeniibacter mangrovi]QID16761.1 polysaccharide export protein EpsE [Nitrogeniibacter mangrovi]
MIHRLTRPLVVFAVALLVLAQGAFAQAPVSEYVLGSGDIIRITVFQNPDLTTETRVSEAGAITFPLVGTVKVGSLTIPAAEQAIADQLRSGGFVLKPQVNILPLQIRSNQVAVLGQVNRPGRYPLETLDTRLSDMLATAGGISPNGADEVVLVGARHGEPLRVTVDIPEVFAKGDFSKDLLLQGGDRIYVQRAPKFYIYGQVNRPGAFRLEPGMTVMQGLATGGGITPRGTEKGLQIHRRGADGKIEVVEPKLTSALKNNDVIYVRESLF